MEHVDVTRLGWVLVHFAWQGVALAALAAPVLWALRGRGPAARYWVACGALLAMVVCPVATWVALAPETGPVTRTLSREGVSGYLEVAAGEAGGGLEAWFPVLVWVWLSGALGLLARLAGGWGLAWRTANRGVVEAPEGVRAAARRLAGRLRLGEGVAVRTSFRVSAPQVFGWLKPVVLLPAASLAQLTPAQLEMVLAHELAHVARRDFLVNVLQTLAESVLFYHPAVWWISGRIRAEREHCCDDVAVALCGDTVEYSRTLLALEEARPYLNPAANAGDLRGRVARILGLEKEERMNAMPILLGVVVVGAGLLMAAPPAPPAPPDAPVAPKPPVLVAQAPAPPAIPVAPVAPAKAPAAAKSAVKAPQAPGAPPPPPPPPATPRGERFSRMTPDERVDVEREIARARKEIEAARGEIEREARVALREAQRELEKERPKIEAEIRAALAEVKSLEGKQISEEVRKSVEAALAQLDSTQFQKGVVEAALRSSEEALKASAAALAQVEKNLAESRRASAAASSAAAVAPAAAPTPAAAPAAAETERERRVRYADNKWTKGATKGSETAKGRAYLQYGPPDEIEVTPSKIEKWHYRARAGQAERFVEFDADGKKVKDELVK